MGTVGLALWDDHGKRDLAQDLKGLIEIIKKEQRKIAENSGNMNLLTGLELQIEGKYSGGTQDDSANYAGAIKTDIPESSDGVERVIASYKRSDLFKFHNDFDRTQHDSPNRWSETYDKYHSQDQRAEQILMNPAPALLKPNNIQYLTRRLMAEGWHPKHIAGLIRSKYERDYGWGKKEGGNFNFHKYDACAHANKWVRFYGGLISTGLDSRITRD